MKYKIIIPVLLFSAVQCITQPQTVYWLRQQTPTLAWLRKISFPDTLNGWAAGDSGRIIHTSNGGQNWVTQNSGINYLIDDLFFLNSRHGWAVANDFFYTGSTIVRTTNGGLNWTSSRYPDTTLILNTIYFLDSLIGWLAGFNGVILQTTNGGLNWSNRKIDSSECPYFPIKSFAFRSYSYAFACGGYFDVQGHVLKTTNSGFTWAVSCISLEPIFDLVFLDSLRLIGAGGDYEYGASVVKTSNGGTTWQYIPLNIFGTGYSIAFRTRAEGWIPLGFAGTWAYTLDSGNTWNQYAQTDTSYVYDVTFPDPYHGWAAGYNGVILKYNSELIGIPKQNEQFPASTILFQNYPNPFNPATTIEFYAAKPGRVKILLYDLLGREAAVLMNEFRKAGKHKIKFNAGRLPSGVYFYELISSGFSETKKLVIMK